MKPRRIHRYPIYYAHSWEELDKKELSEEERKQEKVDQELNSALAGFFNEKLSEYRIKVMSKKDYPSTGYYRSEEERLIGSSVGLIAVFASEAEEAKEELKIAKKLKKPYMFLWDKEKVSAEFIKGFLKKGGHPFERDKLIYQGKLFYEALTPISNYLNEDFIEKVGEEIRKKSFLKIK